jgi:eukaryotic-like serine/threonine-protein kinase
VTKPSNPPTPASGDSEPGPAPSLPPNLPADAGLWDDADMHALRGPSPTFSDAPRGAGDEPAPSIGHIGRYGLKYLLGEGGIGTVYAAHDPLLSRLIAVKTLHVEVEDSERESFNALFLNEARAAAGLSHPHIVTVFDAGVSDKRAYIAMELLKGRDLRQLREEGWRRRPRRSPAVWPMRSATRTARAWCIATSSLPTSSWSAARNRKCSISASPTSRTGKMG